MKRLVLLLFFFSVHAQDTITVMSYNILNYLSTDANRFRYKDIREVVQYLKPHVAMFCEIVDSNAPKLLLDSAFNAAGVGTYTRAVFFNGTDTDNMLFYQPSKIKLLSQKQIYTTLRDISRYVMYRLKSNGDTVKIFFHMAHLKAGSTTSDENQRNSEINSFCSSLTSVPSTVAVVIGGDFNLKSAAEPAWNTLTSGSLCPHTFYDPISQPGLWYNNPAYAGIHTQSTRSSAYPGCCGGATGGLDDRFDFLLINQAIQSGTNDVTYVPGSYQAVGNDGQHFKLSQIEAPANTSVPSNVNAALFNISDHLPVSFKLVMNVPTVGFDEFSYENKNEVHVFYKEDAWELLMNEGIEEISLTDITGKCIFKKIMDTHSKSKSLTIYRKNFSQGIYLLKVKSFDEEKYLKLIN